MGVRPALDHDNVFLLTDAEVLRLNTDESGREVTDVVVNHLGRNVASKATLWWSQLERPIQHGCC